ncbi:HlyD family secretion protein [Photobacterium lipolyticum]|uniref:Hemolysin D n=1 Tax=Photobacterium lipolyticum TaxID=266810 RepID=A0A2T3N1Q5_9GAMM|nr:HlyD family efflux transporter periplasmic adaptor subunit [Photobacterium lipolyticum]PSW06239.1 hemolysin D [Photobacterium lipolyticum]
MSQQIFREEYLQQQHQTEQGQILILSGLNQRIVTVCCIVVIGAILILLALGSYTKKTELEGVIVPSTGLIAVKAAQNGVLEAIDVEDGQQIGKSASLFRVNSEVFDTSGESINLRLKRSLEHQFNSLQSQRDYERLVTQSRIDELISKIDRLDLEIKSVQQSLEFAKQRTQLKKEARDSYQKLLKNNYISELSFKDYLSSLVSLQVDEENRKIMTQQLERERVAAQHQIDYMSLQGNLRTLELERQIDSLKQQQIELTSASETVVHSPVSGKITTLRAEIGQSVSQGEVLLNIIPEQAKLQVELYAPSRSIGFLRPGQPVRLRFDAYPHEKFGMQKGSVVQISQSTLTPAELKAQDQTIRSDAETLYRIVVSLSKSTIGVYGREEPLRVGMRVSADINVETRKLYEWLLGPIARMQGINE